MSKAYLVSFPEELVQMIENHPDLLAAGCAPALIRGLVKKALEEGNSSQLSQENNVGIRMKCDQQRKHLEAMGVNAKEIIPIILELRRELIKECIYYENLHKEKIAEYKRKQEAENGNKS